MYCVELAAMKIDSILASQSEYFFDEIDHELIHQVFEKAFQYHRQCPTFDSKKLILALMRFSDARSVFDLLEKERKKVLDKETIKRENRIVIP